jgi:hypothetical protein
VLTLHPVLGGKRWDSQGPAQATAEATLGVLILYFLLRPTCPIGGVEIIILGFPSPLGPSSGPSHPDNLEKTT